MIPEVDDPDDLAGFDPLLLGDRSRHTLLRVRAMAIHEFGGSEVIEAVDLPTPSSALTSS